MGRILDYWNLNMETPRSTSEIVQEWRDSEGYLHREDGPAVISSTGRMEWWWHGARHRLDGPAVILPDGTTQYWVYGWDAKQDDVASISPVDEESMKSSYLPRGRNTDISTQELYNSLVNTSILGMVGITPEAFGSLYTSFGWDYDNPLKSAQRYLSVLFSHEFKYDLNGYHIAMLMVRERDMTLSVKKALEYGDMLTEINASRENIDVIRRN